MTMCAQRLAVVAFAQWRFVVAIVGALTGAAILSNAASADAPHAYLCVFHGRVLPCQPSGRICHSAGGGSPESFEFIKPLALIPFAQNVAPRLEFRTGKLTYNTAVSNQQKALAMLVKDRAEQLYKSGTAFEEWIGLYERTAESVQELLPGFQTGAEKVIQRAATRAFYIKSETALAATLPYDIFIALFGDVYTKINDANGGPYAYRYWLKNGTTDFRSIGRIPGGKPFVIIADSDQLPPDAMKILSSEVRRDIKNLYSTTKCGISGYVFELRVGAGQKISIETNRLYTHAPNMPHDGYGEQLSTEKSDQSDVLSEHSSRANVSTSGTFKSIGLYCYRVPGLPRYRLTAECTPVFFKSGHEVAVKAIQSAPDWSAWTSYAGDGLFDAFCSASEESVRSLVTALTNRDGDFALSRKMDRYFPSVTTLVKERGALKVLKFAKSVEYRLDIEPVQAASDIAKRFELPAAEGNYVSPNMTLRIRQELLVCDENCNNDTKYRKPSYDEKESLLLEINKLTDSSGLRCIRD